MRNIGGQFRMVVIRMFELVEFEAYVKVIVFEGARHCFNF